MRPSMRACSQPARSSAWAAGTRVAGDTANRRAVSARQAAEAPARGANIDMLIPGGGVKRASGSRSRSISLGDVRPAERIAKGVDGRFCRPPLLDIARQILDSIRHPATCEEALRCRAHGYEAGCWSAR